MRVVAIDQAQRFEHVAALLGEAVRHFYKLAPAMREAVSHQDFHTLG